MPPYVNPLLPNNVSAPFGISSKSAKDYLQNRHLQHTKLHHFLQKQGINKEKDIPKSHFSLLGYP